MRATRITFTILTIALVALGVSTTAYAFHSGGVAECGGCHSMHSPNQGGTYLLIKSDPSSTCLNCHENAADTGPSSYHISTADSTLGLTGVGFEFNTTGIPLQRTPGGDFSWLKKNYVFTVRGTSNTELGETHGHNIVALDFNYEEDAVNTEAPGGGTNPYLSERLGCESCHDPHGKYRRLSTGTIATTGAPIIGSGSYDTSTEPAAGEAVGVYRLLGGIGYDANGLGFTKDPPHAVTPGTYNRTESTTQTRTAYGKGMSDWCAQCHPDMHTSSGKTLHPMDQQFGSSVKNIYDQYRGSGNMGGSNATAFLSLVPFDENSAVYTDLKAHAKNNDSYLNGPAANALVSCMSCHRAHATGWEYGLRWNMEGEFIVYAGVWPGTDTTPTRPQFARGRTGAETQAAYYDRPASTFATYQRVLCNKCHAKD